MGKFELDKIYCGDCRDLTKQLPNNSIDMCITSPPYWGLRDYGIGKDQLGLESDFNLYIKNLCDIFDEVKRVLKNKGTCWVNIGDVYGGSGGASGHTEYTKNLGYITSKMGATKGHTKNIMPKCLIMIPFRFAIEMVNRGWILRNTIIWHKPDCVPSSAKDRFTVDFEYLFFFSKSKKYYFEQQLEPWTDKNKYDVKRAMYGHKEYKGKYKSDKKGSFSLNKSKVVGDPTIGRNKRTVWSITTTGFKGTHFSIFPEKLIETPIKAGCPEGGILLDPFIGSGTTGVVAIKQRKHFIGFEINPECMEKIANPRLSEVQVSIL